MVNVIDFSQTKISDVWEGFFLNHLVPPEHPNHDKPYQNPSNIDWKRNLDTGVYLKKQKPIIVNFLWAGIIYNLPVNSESDDRELLPEPIPIVLIKFDYGSFDNGLPEKQDSLLYGYYRPEFGATIELRYYKTLHDNLVNTGNKTAIASKRRQLAKNYITQRAAEIQQATDDLFASLGSETATAQGLTQVDLIGGVELFYNQFATEMYAYIESGSLNINQEIQTILNSSVSNPNEWMRNNILIGINEDNSFNLAPAGLIIAQLFAQATLKITQADIDNAIADTIQLQLLE